MSNNRIGKKLTATAAMAVALAAIAPTWSVAQPAPPVAGAPVSAAQTVSPDWWQAFGDPQLDALVAQAIAGNYDLKVLAARTQVAADIARAVSLGRRGM